VSKTAILGDWVHAHERDSAGVKVYVDAGEPLPPSRGRHRMTFRSDGTFVESQPGADDRVVQAGGTYQFDGTKLVLQRASGAQPVVYEAVRSSDGKRLELKKV
jgi:hypothetical protein